MSPLIAKAHTISTVLIWQLNGALGAIFRAEICFDSDLLSSSSSSGGEMARNQKLLLLAWNTCTVGLLCIQHPHALAHWDRSLKNIVNLFNFTLVYWNIIFCRLRLVRCNVLKMICLYEKHLFEFKDVKNLKACTLYIFDTPIRIKYRYHTKPLE